MCAHVLLGGGEVW